MSDTNVVLQHFAEQRLFNQGLVQPKHRSPLEIVTWFGAVQSQDVTGAEWTLGLRGARLEEIRQAYAEGQILRTHVMRPTWHFVAPADIRWMQALTAQRVNARNAHYDKLLGLDESIYTRSNDVIAKALQGGKYLTRPELREALQAAGVPNEGTQRLAHLIMRAELGAIICNGPMRGKQYTYALLEERVPPAPALAQDEALAELTRRYFRSHGPATPQDFSWWSGLTVADARKGLELLGSEFEQETVGKLTYWFPTNRQMNGTPEKAYLMSNYDEYTVAYKQHEVVTHPPFSAGAAPYPHALIIDGQVAGMWKRTFQKKRLVVEFDLLRPLGKEEMEATRAAAERYGVFLGMDVQLVSEGEMI